MIVFITCTVLDNIIYLKKIQRNYYLRTKNIRYLLCQADKACGLTLLHFVSVPKFKPFLLIARSSS